MAERAALSILNGLVRGIREGLEIRQKKDQADRELAIKEAETFKKQQAEASKADYFSEKLEIEKEKVNTAREALDLKRRDSFRKDEDISSDLIRTKSQLNNDLIDAQKQRNQLTEQINTLGFSPRMREKNADAIAELQDQVKSLDEHAASIRKDMQIIDKKVSGSGVKPQALRKPVKLSPKSQQIIDGLLALDNESDIQSFLQENESSIPTEDRGEIKKAIVEKMNLLKSR